MIASCGYAPLGADEMNREYKNSNVLTPDRMQRQIDDETTNATQARLEANKSSSRGECVFMASEGAVRTRAFEIFAHELTLVF